MLAAFDEIVEPAARRFRPDIILVSAGYDAHWRDPLAGLQLRSSSYHSLGARLAALASELCGGRLVMLLEGGYDLKALGESVANTFLGELYWLLRPCLVQGTAVWWAVRSVELLGDCNQQAVPARCCPAQQ